MSAIDFTFTVPEELIRKVAKSIVKSELANAKLRISEKLHRIQEELQAVAIRHVESDKLEVRLIMPTWEGREDE